MCYDRKLFRHGSLHADHSRIQCANGGIVEAEAMGVVDVRLEGNRTMTLDNVLLVPRLKQNLISVSFLQRSGYTVLFYGDKDKVSCHILHTNELICSVPQTHGMWLVGLSTAATPSATTQTAHVAITLDDLHHRLGHAHKDKLLHMLDKGQLAGLTLVGPRQLDNCYGCALGKQHMHSLVTDIDKPTTRRLDLIHMDLMGPFATAKQGGHRYVLTIIDDNSRFCWVEFLHKKSDVYDKFLAWSTRIEREANTTLSRIRVDNGGEFKNARMDALCTSHGYTQEFTNSYTPQQNGVAERYNRALLDTVRSIMSAANVSVKWWGEALQCANYMRNRTSHNSVRKRMSPYQKWTGRKPQIHLMHVFGCRATVLSVKPKLTKLGPKSTEGLFLGYSSSSPGYRILLNTGVIVESSDVLFLDSTVLKRNYDHFYRRDTLLCDSYPSYLTPTSDAPTPSSSPSPSYFTLPTTPPLMTWMMIQTVPLNLIHLSTTYPLKIRLLTFH